MTPPYSIRSFVLQASEYFRGTCVYTTAKRGGVMNEPVFDDTCFHSPEIPDGADVREYQHPCHLVSGFTLGEGTCPLWENVLGLCSTSDERWFLRAYLNLVKDRQFPMLIPQVPIGIAERHRPDFVAYVPIQRWLYRWFAIELDGGHQGSTTAARDEKRDLELSGSGYEVITVKRHDGKSIYDLKNLLETFERHMNRAASAEFDELLSIGVDLTVAETLYPTTAGPNDDLPF